MASEQICYQISVPSRLESLAAVSEFVAQTGQTLGLEPEQTHRLQLAADEACTNLILHGQVAESHGERMITLDLCRTRDRCILTLRDHGRPFDLTALPAPRLKTDLRRRRPGGLGVYLIRTLMDEVTYRSEDGVNTLTMIKRL